VIFVNWVVILDKPDVTGANPACNVVVAGTNGTNIGKVPYVTKFAAEKAFNDVFKALTCEFN
jgi:hypothetical protein